MPNQPDVGFSFGVEGDQQLLATINRLREELKNLAAQHDSVKSSAIDLSSAWRGLAAAAATLKLAEFAKEAFDSAINIGKMAEKTGLSTEALSVFHKVAGDVGVETEALDKGLVKAARTITLFEQGSKSAAQGFALLGLKQKDFIGLNSDQKMQKVTEALGKMPESFAKATAAQEIFGRGGAELIAVMNQIADQGFDKITEETRRLGLLLGSELVENARLAKEALQDLKDLGEGLTTQFEAGLIPAITDASVALGQSMNAGNDGIKTFGQFVGIIAKQVAEIFIGAGKIIGAVFADVWVQLEPGFNQTRILGIASFEAIADAARFRFADAARALTDAARDARREAESLTAERAAIYKQLGQDLAATETNLFPSAEEEKSFAAAEKVTQDARDNLQKQTAEIRERLLKGLISQKEAEREIKDLLVQELPLLRAKAQAELEYAEAQGHASQIARARATVKQVNALLPPTQPPPLDAGPSKITAPDDAAIKASVRFGEKEAQDELALHRAIAKRDEQIDTDRYQKGLLSLEEYFARRRQRIADDAGEETAILQKALVAANDELRRTAVVSFSAHKEAAVKHEGATPKESARLDDAAKKEADRAAAGEYEALGKVKDLEKQIGIIRIDADTKGNALDRERFTATESHLLKQLEIEQQIAEAAGDTKRVDELKDKIEDLKTRVEELQAGLSATDIDANLGKISAGRDVRRTAAAAQQTFETGVDGKGGVKGLADTKSELGEKVATGNLLPYQASKLLSDEYKRQIPLLEAQVKILRDQAAAIQATADAAAKARGEAPAPSSEAQTLSGKADEDKKVVDNLKRELPSLDAGWMNWKDEAKADIDQISDHLTTGFNGWLAGHEKFRQAVAQTWNNIVLTAVQSIEKIAAQWIAQHLKMLLFKTATDKAGLASTATTTAQGDAIKRASGIKEVIQSAKQAAVHAFTGVHKAFPPPASWILAPIAAGAAFAGALALGAFAQGGAVSKGGAPRYVSFAAGGSIAAQSFFGNSHRAGGGPIRGPGTGTSDSIPILASHGEHVITAAGSSAVGPDVLDAINRDPQGMAARIHGALAVHPEKLQPAGHFADGGAIMRGAFLPAIREPAPYSAEGFHRYAGGGAVEVGGAGGTTNTFHLPTHIGNMSAIDGASMRSLIEEHGDLIGKIGVAAMKRHFRTNGVGG
jgi:hypothetical protein